MRVSTRNLPALKLKYGSLAAAAKMSMANRPFPVQGDEIPMQEEPQPAQEDKPKLRGAMLGQYFIDDFCPAIELKSEPKPKTDFITITTQNLGAWKNESMDVSKLFKSIEKFLEPLKYEAVEMDFDYEMDYSRGFPVLSVVPKRRAKYIEFNVTVSADGNTHVTSGKPITITTNEPITFRG
jgi:hypothetical protein